MITNKNKYNQNYNTGMKNIIIFMFMILLILPMATAEVKTLGKFKQYNCVSLTQVCDNCSYVNITSISNPNTLIDGTSKAMTKNGEVYNYTYCSTSILGNYIYTTCGDLSGTLTCQSINFRITTVGDQSNYLFPLSFIVIAFVLLILGFLFSNEYIGFAAGAMFLVEGVYIMIYGFGELNDLYSRTISFISIGLGAVFLIAAGYTVADKSNLWSGSEDGGDD